MPHTGTNFAPPLASAPETSEALQTVSAQPKSRAKAIMQVASGNVLEMYDFMVFGFYAAAIGKTFFPSSDPTAKLMLALATFGAGFLMRPLGALILGSYVDRIGRKKGLIVTLGLMAIGTLIVTITPGYAAIGFAAPLLILAGRLIQGFSAGVELGSTSVYLSEIAGPHNKGFIVSFQSASQQLAVMAAAALGVGMTHLMSHEELLSWGWRIPFLIGCLIVPVLFLLRRNLQETEAFSSAHSHPHFAEILQTLSREWRIIAVGILMVLMTTTSFYIITAYTPSFGTAVLHLTAHDSLVVTLCAGMTNLILLPVFGALSDRISRKKLLLIATVSGIVTAYPAMTWLVSDPSFFKLLGVELWLAVIYSMYNGAAVVYLTEIVPPRIRTTGFSLAYSLATCVGGFTPFICTSLIHATGNRAMPGLWLTLAACSGLLASLLARPYSHSQSSSS